MKHAEIRAIESAIFKKPKYRHINALDIYNLENDLKGLIHILCHANLLSLNNLDNFDKAYDCAIAVHTHYHDLYYVHRVLQYMNGGMGTILFAPPMPKMLTQTSFDHILKLLSTPYEAAGKKAEHLGSRLQQLLMFLADNAQFNEATLTRFTQNHYQVYVIGSLIMQVGYTFAQYNTLIDASAASPTFWKDCADELSANVYRSNAINNVLNPSLTQGPVVTTAWQGGGSPPAVVTDDKPQPAQKPSVI